jgi:hypothetical protein
MSNQESGRKRTEAQYVSQLLQLWLQQSVNFVYRCSSLGRTKAGWRLQEEMNKGWFLEIAQANR